MIFYPEVLSIAKDSCEIHHLQFHPNLLVFLRPWFMEYNPLGTREIFLKERLSKMLNMELSLQNACMILHVNS